MKRHFIPHIACCRLLYQLYRNLWATLYIQQLSNDNNRTMTVSLNNSGLANQPTKIKNKIELKWADTNISVAQIATPVDDIRRCVSFAFDCQTIVTVYNKSAEMCTTAQIL